ncbi:hypothetical protein A2U01_0087670, partial [Trifolium medium]|nr:hypothetical protein [Trifolium medium]
MAIPEEAVAKCDCKVDDGGSSGDSRGDSLTRELMSLWRRRRKEATLLRDIPATVRFH